MKYSMVTRHFYFRFTSCPQLLLTLLLALISLCLQLYIPWESGFELTSYSYLAMAYFTRSTGGRCLSQLCHR